MHNKIIYLHGFNSSPLSFKAKMLLQHMTQRGQQEHLVIPEISPYPDTAVTQISELISSLHLDDVSKQLCLIGSSLGGYYSTWFAEKHDCPAILINPSVRPYETLAEYIGENENYYSDEKWHFNQSHIQQLLDININEITRAERYLVLLQTGDEVLDYKQAEKKYALSQLQIEQGGDHSFQGFENHIAAMLKFSGL